MIDSSHHFKLMGTMDDLYYQFNYMVLVVDLTFQFKSIGLMAELHSFGIRKKLYHVHCVGTTVPSATIIYTHDDCAARHSTTSFGSTVPLVALMHLLYARAEQYPTTQGTFEIAIGNQPKSGLFPSFSPEEV